MCVYCVLCTLTFVCDIEGGWPWAWNHGAWPNRWGPWQHQSSGGPSSGGGGGGGGGSSTGGHRTGGSASNRGGPWGGTNSSQRSWHSARQTATKFTRWEKNLKKQPPSLVSIFSNYWKKKNLIKFKKTKQNSSFLQNVKTKYTNTFFMLDI